MLVAAQYTSGCRIIRVLYSSTRTPEWKKLLDVSDREHWKRKALVGNRDVCLQLQYVVSVDAEKRRPSVLGILQVRASESVRYPP